MTRQSTQLAFGAGASTAGTAPEAIEQAIDHAADAVGDGPVDLALLFVTAHFEEDAEAVARRLIDRVEPGRLLGCTAESIIGPGVEIEGRPGISVWLARLGDVRVVPFALDRTGIDTADLADSIGVRAEDRPVLIGLADPFTTDINGLLEGLNEQMPGVPLVGGMASGASEPGQNHLLLDGERFDEGMVGVALTPGPEPGLAVRTVVSQGCRPIGEPLVITRAEKNVIFELGGKGALVQLKETFANASQRDRELLQRGLLIGRVINEYQATFTRGDFLIRNVVGFDTEHGALAVLDSIRVGQTVQFHVRDGEAAEADLRSMLADAADSGGADAALLFTCNGRGSRMWEGGGRDVAAIEAHFGSLPLAGLFAAGELGPVGGRNFIHGHTASIALFAPGEE